MLCCLCYWLLGCLINTLINKKWMDHLHHVHPWIRSLDLFGVDALPSSPGASTIASSSGFVVEGVFRKSGVVHSFKMVDQFCLYLGLTSCIPEICGSFHMTSLLILPSLVYPLTLLKKRISAASRRVMSRFVELLLFAVFLTEDLEFILLLLLSWRPG